MSPAAKKSTKKKAPTKKRAAAKSKAPAKKSENLIVEAASFVGKAVARRVGSKVAEVYDLAENILRHEMAELGSKKKSAKKKAPKAKKKR